MGSHNRRGVPVAGPVGAQSDAGQINSILIKTASALSSSRNSLRGYYPPINPSSFYNIKLLKPIIYFIVGIFSKVFKPSRIHLLRAGATVPLNEKLG